MRWTEDQLNDWRARQASGHSNVAEASRSGRDNGVTTEQAPRVPQPNKTEQRYIDEVLAPALVAGEVADWRFEAMNLRLGPRLHYRPDFLVVLPDGLIRFDEVKGGWAEEDAIVKFKTAVHQFPWFAWRLCRYDRKSWSVEVWR